MIVHETLCVTSSKIASTTAHISSSSSSSDAKKSMVMIKRWFFFLKINLFKILQRHDKLIKRRIWGF
ncbi:unnamed protein product [Trifolium pratense]|uniref:Uncharacterized protein n=1 Tax=Trifolium pratense TaxID=57577 RepID=A0ACB0LXF7_TRIPR|nr:unnamed protein product [Trifolium pratense]